MIRHARVYLLILALYSLGGLFSPLYAEDEAYFTGSLLSLGSIPTAKGYRHYFTGQIQTRGNLFMADGSAITISPGTPFAGYFVYDASMQDTRAYHQGVGHYSMAPDDHSDVDTLPIFSLTLQITQGLLTLNSTGAFEALVDAANPDLHSFWAYWDIQGRDLELRLEDEGTRALQHSRLPKTFALPHWTGAELLIPMGLLGSLESDAIPPAPDNVQIVPAPAHLAPSLAWEFPRQEDGTSLKDLAGYNVCCGLYARFDATACSEPIDIDVEPHATTLQLKALIPGRTYYCTVQTHDLAGQTSIPSPTVSIWAGSY